MLWDQGFILLFSMWLFDFPNIVYWTNFMSPSLSVSVKNQFAINVWLYFWTMCYNLLGDMSAFMATLCCLDSCSGWQRFALDPFGFLCWKVGTQCTNAESNGTEQLGLRGKSLGRRGHHRSTLLGILSSFRATCIRISLSAWFFCLQKGLFFISVPTIVMSSYVISCPELRKLCFMSRIRWNFFYYSVSFSISFISVYSIEIFNLLDN